jgi:hypothetical protein
MHKDKYLDIKRSYFILYLAIIISALLLFLVMYRSEILFLDLPLFIPGDEEYYQWPEFIGKSSYYAFIAQIPSPTNFKEVSRLIQILIFSIIFAKVYRVRGINELFIVLVPVSASAFVNILVRDPWILFSVFGFVFSVTDKGGRKVIRIIMLILSLLFLTNVANDILCVLLLSFVIVYIIQNPLYIIKIGIIIIVLFILIAAWDEISYLLTLNIVEGARSGGIPMELSFKGVLTAIVTFYTGPGFPRIIFSGEYFQERYSFSYLMSYFFMTLSWYLFLVWIFAKISVKKLIMLYSENCEFALYITFAVMFSFVYILADAGSTGYRKRFIVFSLIISGFMKYRKDLIIKGFRTPMALFIILLLIVINYYSV